MTEYWKSQARKFCEFCNCWLADNKVSIQFHENGKRHKENAKKHITKLYKKSAKDQKQKNKMDDEIKKMEKAAMSAYMKDLENNADLTSKSINSALGQSTEPPPAPVFWQEVKSDDGNIYYWNTETNETVWDPPESYVSLAEQEEKALKEKKNEEEKALREKKELEERTKREEELLKQKQQEAILEVKAYMEREKLKERAVKEEKKSTPFLYGPIAEPEKPYGSWTPVIHKPEEKIDLQLPKVQTFEPPVVMEPEVIKFKEKKVDSLGEGPVDFKKRKLNSNFKRNMRQKIDDE